MKIQLLTCFSILSLFTFSQGNETLANFGESHTPTEENDLHNAATGDDWTSYDSTFIHTKKHTIPLEVGQNLKIRCNRQVQTSSGEMKTDKYNLRGKILNFEEGKLIMQSSYMSGTPIDRIDTISFSSINTIRIFNGHLGKRLLGGLLKAVGATLAIAGTTSGLLMLTEPVTSTAGGVALAVGAVGAGTWVVGNKMRGRKYRLKEGKRMIHQQ